MMHPPVMSLAAPLLVVIIAAAANFSPLTAIAEETKSLENKVVWSCSYTRSGENVIWLVEAGLYTSYIKVFDERIAAMYRMEGLNKYWRWGAGLMYGISLTPAGSANYYSFTALKSGEEVVVPGEQYYCKK